MAANQPLPCLWLLGDKGYDGHPILQPARVLEDYNRRCDEAVRRGCSVTALVKAAEEERSQFHRTGTFYGEEVVLQELKALLPMFDLFNPAANDWKKKHSKSARQTRHGGELPKYGIVEIIYKDLDTAAGLLEKESRAFHLQNRSKMEYDRLAKLMFSARLAQALRKELSKTIFFLAMEDKDGKVACGRARRNFWYHTSRKYWEELRPTVGGGSFILERQTGPSAGASSRSTVAHWNVSDTANDGVAMVWSFQVLDSQNNLVRTVVDCSAHTDGRGSVKVTGLRKIDDCPDGPLYTATVLASTSNCSHPASSGVNLTSEIDLWRDGRVVTVNSNQGKVSRVTQRELQALSRTFECTVLSGLPNETNATDVLTLTEKFLTLQSNLPDRSRSGTSNSDGTSRRRRRRRGNHGGR